MSDEAHIQKLEETIRLYAAQLIEFYQEIRELRKEIELLKGDSFILCALCGVYRPSHESMCGHCAVPKEKS